MSTIEHAAAEASAPAAAPAPILSREALLAADDRAEKVIEVPEWGGSVKIKALSLGAWQDAMERSTVDGKVDDNLAGLHTLLVGIVEPELSAEDYEQLRNKGIDGVMRVMGEIASLSGVDANAIKAAEATFPQE